MFEQYIEELIKEPNLRLLVQRTNVDMDEAINFNLNLKFSYLYRRKENLNLPSEIPESVERLNLESEYYLIYRDFLLKDHFHNYEQRKNLCNDQSLKLINPISKYNYDLQCLKYENIGVQNPIFNFLKSRIAIIPFIESSEKN